MSGSFSILVEEKLGKLPHFLIYAILEWIVIILLFVEGFLSFVCNELARFFDLKNPCLLCTRIDNMFVHRSSNFYYNESICEDHKKDISSLAYCNVHQRLSDIRTMCQGCLISFSMERDPGLDKYKSVVGKSKKDMGFLDEDDKKFLIKSLKKDGSEIECKDKSGVMRCSCCGEPLKSKPSSKHKKSLSMNATASSPTAAWLSMNAPASSPRGSWLSMTAPAPAASPRAPWLSMNAPAPASSPIAPWLGRNEEEGNMDFPPIRYTEVKLVADSELELPEDEEDGSHVNNPGRGMVKPATVPLLQDTEDVSDFAARTPSTRINKFFGIPLSDSAQTMSPRWAGRSSRKRSYDRLDFILEANDAREAADADILTRMKRQIRLDRKALTALQMELDEERSASAVAANNAMAMISRLQAEKAAVQMEALQYKRMSEEQAEYDEEALQMMKDMLCKKDQELDMYREKYGQVEKTSGDICDEVYADDYQDTKSPTLSERWEDHNEHEHPTWIPYDVEGERSYLEQKVNAPSSRSSKSAQDSSDDESREVSLISERLRAHQHLKKIRLIESPSKLIDA